MKYEDIHNFESTLSANNSEKLFREIVTLDWRCYSSALRDKTEALIDRFLASHARQPGIITEEMIATTPIDVFRYTANEVHVEGVSFTNGSVVTLVKESTVVQLLFIDEVTATRWSYPKNGFTHLKEEIVFSTPPLQPQL